MGTLAFSIIRPNPLRSSQPSNLNGLAWLTATAPNAVNFFSAISCVKSLNKFEIESGRDRKSFGGFKFWRDYANAINLGYIILCAVHGSPQWPL